MNTIRHYLVVYLGALAIVALMTLASLALAQDLTLGRVIADGADSHAGDINPRGFLRIDADEDNVIRGMEFTARARDGSIDIDRNLVAIDYLGNGARYEFFDWDTDELITVTFLRRAPLNDSYDPATIFIYADEDLGPVILDYRYTE